MAELLDLAQRIASWGQPGEEVEAFVAWQRETEVRAYGGEVESLSSAESAGIGIRVVAGARQGFAYVGNLDEALARDALAEARDNASFATPDPNVGLAEPDGVAPAPLELWDDSLDSMATEEKIALALELERRVRAGDARIREVVSADYGDDQSESAVASSSGIERGVARHDLLSRRLRGRRRGERHPDRRWLQRVPGAIRARDREGGGGRGLAGDPDARRDEACERPRHGRVRPGGHGDAPGGARRDALG